MGRSKTRIVLSLILVIVVLAVTILVLKFPSFSSSSPSLLQPLSGKAIEIPLAAASYSFETETAGITPDSSGNGYDGEVIGATLMPGRFGNAYYFDGNNDYIELGDVFDLAPEEDLTLEAWVKTTSTLTGLKEIMGTENRYPYYHLATFYDGGLVELYPRIAFDGTHYVLARGGSEVNIADGKWHQIVVVFDRDENMTTYLDGEVYGEPKPIAQLQNLDLSSNTSFRIGTGYIGGPSYFFKGMIDEVNIYQDALTNEQVQSNYLEKIHWPVTCDETSLFPGETFHCHVYSESTLPSAIASLRFTSNLDLPKSSRQEAEDNAALTLTSVSDDSYTLVGATETETGEFQATYALADLEGQGTLTGHVLDFSGIAPSGGDSFTIELTALDGNELCSPDAEAGFCLGNTEGEILDNLNIYFNPVNFNLGSLLGDSNSDGQIDNFELLNFIDLWYQGMVNNFDLLTVIESWYTN